MKTPWERLEVIHAEVEKLKEQDHVSRADLLRLIEALTLYLKLQLQEPKAKKEN